MPRIFDNIELGLLPALPLAQVFGVHAEAGADLNLAVAQAGVEAVEGAHRRTAGDAAR